jgi:thiol-disulfide isomerase/thioredoxin
MLLLAAAQAGAATQPPQQARLTIVRSDDAGGITIANTSQLSVVDPAYGEHSATMNSLTGNWEITIPLSEPQYFLLLRNPLYLSAGDDLVIELDPEPTKSTITGRGAEVNNYLKERFYFKGGSYLASGRYVKPTLEETMAVMDSIVAARRAALASLDATDEFKRVEQMRLKADYVNSLVYYPTYNRSMFGSDVLPRDEYNAILGGHYERIRPVVQPLLDEMAADDKFLDIEVLRFTLHRFSGMDGYRVERSPWFDQLFEVGECASRINGSLSAEKYDELAAYGKGIESEVLRRIFMDRLDRNMRFTGGKPAVDFPVTDMEGTVGMLSDYKGSVMYVDVWATWCGPCIAQAPYFRELSEKYPAIRFVALSTDDKRETWENYMEGKDHGRILELWAEPDMRKKWNISGIPRFLLIDADFNIISTDAPRPTDRETIERLLDRHSK